MMRKVADKVRLVHRDVLVSMDRLAWHHLKHAINKQERIAMWQVLKNLVNIHLINPLN